MTQSSIMSQTVFDGIDCINHVPLFITRIDGKFIVDTTISYAHLGIGPNNPKILVDSCFNGLFKSGFRLSFQEDYKKSLDSVDEYELFILRQQHHRFKLIDRVSGPVSGNSVIEYRMSRNRVFCIKLGTKFYSFKAPK